MKKKGLIRKIFSFAAVLSFILRVAVISYALPSGEQVVSGDASFQQTDPGTLTITTSDKAIINYDSFSIAQSETVRFIQPSSSSVVLNRVVGIDPSQLYGSLLANGQVFLINPNGIFFGPNSLVDSGSFVASTLDISNEDFLSGNYRFGVQEGKDFSYVVNQGNIKAGTGGYVALISPLVSNEGSISAPSGKVLVAGTDQLVVNFDGAGVINFAIPVSGGTGAAVVMPAEHATDIIRSVVNTPVLVEAGGIVEENGVVRLVGAGGLAINSGSISVDGGSGRDAGAVVIDSRLATVLTPGSSVSASGRGENSDGGDIRILSDMENGISAVGSGAELQVKGGEISGSGGFIEISSASFILKPDAVLDMSAANGVAGIFLLDPNDITISGLADFNMDRTGTPWFSTSDNAIVNTTTLLNALKTGDVTIQTRTGAPDAQNGDIFVSGFDYNTMGATRTLTLQADRNIVINGAIQDSVAGGETLNLVLTANRNAGTAGDVDINAAISTSGGSLTSTGVNFDNTGGIIDTAGGAVSLTHSGIVTIGSAIGGTSAVGTTDITGTGGIHLGAGITSSNAAITFHNTADLTANVVVSSGAGAGNIVFSSTIDGEHTLSIQAGTGDVTLTGAVGATTALISLTVAGNDISLANIGDAAGEGVTGATLVTASDAGADAGSITFTGTTYNANAQTYNAGSAANVITMNAGAPTTFTSSNDNIAFTGAVILASGSDLTVTTGSTGAGDISFGGTVNGTTAGAEDITLEAGTGNITFSADLGGSVTLGVITISSAADVSAAAITAVSFTQSAGTGTTTFNGLVSTSGNDSVTTGSIAFSGAGSINANAGEGDVTLTAGTGSITSGAAAADVIAKNLYLSSVTGIGASGNALSTQVVNLQASNSGSGDVRIDNTGDLNVFGGGVTNGTGSVYLTSTSNIMLTSAVTAFSVILTADGSIKDDEDENGNDVTSTGDTRLTATHGTIGSSNPIEVKVGGGLYIGAGGSSESGVSAALKGTSGDGMVHLLFACPGLVIFNGMIFNAGSQINQGLAQLNPYIANTLPSYMVMTIFGVDENLTRPRHVIVSKISGN